MQLNSLNEIIGFDYNPASLLNYANSVISARLDTNLDSQIRKLQTISEKIGNQSFQFSGTNLIPQIFKKAKAFTKTGISLHENLNRRELRTLSFAIDYSEHGLSSFFSNVDDLALLLHSLNLNWRDSYLIGLLDCYLRSWDTSTSYSKDILGKFIIEKLKTYQGSRMVIKSLKANQRFFLNNGDVILGAELAIKNIPIDDATKYLSLPAEYITYGYFSKVILSYYEKKKNEISSIINDLIGVLRTHNNYKTNKRVISKFVIQANSGEFMNLRHVAKSLGFKFIGDPGKPSEWLPFDNATELEKTDLVNARRILNEWITQEFINVFFEKCLNDRRRKLFWLKYSNKISNFKVFGSAEIKKVLKLDQRIKDFVDGKFQSVGSYRNISAFMFEMGNYRLIEFSDPGYAFYAYKVSNPLAPSLDKRYVDTVDSFRNGSLPQLVYKSGISLHNFSEEGRLNHSDGDLRWENVFSRWLNKYINV